MCRTKGKQIHECTTESAICAALSVIIKASAKGINVNASDGKGDFLTF